MSKPYSGFKLYELTLANGFQWRTEINANCSHESTVQYFLGQYFNSESYPLEDMQKCVSVKFLGMIEQTP